MPRNRTASYVFVLLAVTALAAVSWFSLSYINQKPMAFNRTRWLQAREEEDWHVRSAMARDLINRNVLPGQTRDQVIALLGKPESYVGTKDQELYYLVREDWDMIDPIRRDHLLISMDPESRTVSARIDIFKRPKYNRL